MLNIKNWSVYLDRLIEKNSQVSDISQQFKSMVTHAARSGVGEVPAPSSGDQNDQKATPQAQEEKQKRVEKKHFDQFNKIKKIINESELIKRWRKKRLGEFFNFYFSNKGGLVTNMERYNLNKSRKRNLNHLFSTDEETDRFPAKFKSDKNADECSANEEIEIEQVEEQVITS